MLKPLDFAEVTVLPARASYPKNHHQNHLPKHHHQNHDFWDVDFDVGFVDDSFDDFVDGLQDALPSPYNVKLARYDLLTMSNWRVTVSLQCQTTVLRSPYNVKLPCYCIFM